MSKPRDYDKMHLQNLSVIRRKIESIFKKAAEEAAKIGVSIRQPLKDNRIFNFDDYPETQKLVDKLLESLHKSMEITIVNGVRSSWTLSNNKNSALASRVFGKHVKDLSKEQYRRYFSTNGAALDAFLKRKEKGLNLSDRVWKYTGAFKNEIELGLDLGIRSGESAATMTRSLTQYLQYPDKLFRRVRDEHGILQLSKAAKAFHPGTGVYRSSYKNALRLAATETTIAYRTRDYLRWQQMDFVVGIEIRMSNNHPIEDICDELAGRYPKDFKFTGWHPFCRCHVVPALKTEEEMDKDTQRIIDGEEPLPGSVNGVKDVPPAFRDWINSNSDRLARAKSAPYFLTDNPQYSQGVPARLLTEQAKSLPMPAPQAEAFTPVPLDRLRQEYDVSFRRGVPETAYTEGIASKFDFQSIRQQVYQALAEVGIPISKQAARIGADYFTVNFEGEDKDGKSFTLTRSFTDRGENGIEVHHDLFQLPKSAQGKGTSKRVLGMFYEEYKRMGVTEISVDANIDVGGYTWARYGFNATDKHEALEAVCKTPKAQQFIEDYYSKNGLSEDKPFPMYLLTEQPWGKNALLGSFWEGRLNLKDPTQRARFEKYLGLR